ncbi:MFS transporter [Pacificimonas sp. WHA3]|uniref:MFS transporter n=1 Tax=Pacificimonas pallii TaxID=2827236 RepID=A0ABS6SAB3_9SPHN|nr:MFS transporter [Pacificimonas pallii]
MIGYSVGSIGTGVYMTAPSVLLLYYMTDILGVSPALAGLGVFIPRLWDMVTDPAMGWISDRTRSRWGRRRPYLLVGGIATATSFGLLFSAPDLPGEGWNFAYVLIVYIFSATAYTVFAVPYLAMPAEMSADPHERAGIMAYRMTFAMTGVLIGAAAAPALVTWFGGGREGFAGMSWTMGAICAATMLITFRATVRVPVITPDKIERPALLREAFTLPGFRTLALAYALQLAGLGVFTASAPYVTLHMMRRGEADISFIFLALLGGTLASLLVWDRVSRKTGKTPAYIAAAAISMIGFVAMLLLHGAEDWQALIVMTAIAGIGFGGLQLLPFAMLTDVIHTGRLRGVDAAGSLTGVWTAVEKGSLALGPLIVGLLLSVGGFDAAAQQQGVGVVDTIRWTIGAVPTTLILLSVPALILYHRSQ